MVVPRHRMSARRRTDKEPERAARTRRAGAPAARFEGRTPFDGRARVLIAAGFATGRVMSWAHALLAAGRARGERARSRVPKPVAVGLCLTLVVALTGGFQVSPRHRTSPANDATLPMEWAGMERPLALAPADAPPEAAPASLVKAGPLRSREVFAFAPYWSLGGAAPDVRGLTTIAYFGVDIAPNGSIIRDGNGWVGFESQDLANLITDAHRAGVRVVLTAKSFDAGVLRSLATSPTAGRALAGELTSVLRSKRFDGVNLDFEGFGDSYRARFSTFVATVATALHAADPSWQVTVDTYATSAQAPDGFFDVATIARAVDALFVMGYDMYDSGTASPNAPLPQYAASIEAYTALVAPSKLIYGTPFYGYDWPTSGNGPHATATGSPTPVTYADLVTKGYPRYWDADASVPWSAYRDGFGHWHEVYYDDPSSLALKSRLADSHHLRGVGAWALGMDRTDASMIAALAGMLRTIVFGPSGPIGRSAPAPSARPAQPKPASSHQAGAASSPSPRPSSSPSPSPSPTPIIPLPL